MSGSRHDGLSNELQRLLDDYRSGSSPSDVQAERVRGRLESSGVLPIAVKTSSLALRVLLGIAVVGGAGVAVSQRDRERPADITGSPTERAPTEVRPVEPAVLPATVAQPDAPEPASPPMRAPTAVGPRASTSARDVDASDRCDATLADELAVLERARIELGRGRNTQTLAVLDAHEQRCDRGPMLEERRALRSLALCGSGALERGRAQARMLLAEHPSSALAGRIRSACTLDE